MKSYKSLTGFYKTSVEHTSNLTFEKINEILEVREEIVELIRKETKLRRPEQLTEVIFTQPYTKVKHFTDEGIYAENTARDYLNKLVDLGVMEKKTFHGHHYYLNLELYRILAE